MGRSLVGHRWNISHASRDLPAKLIRGSTLATKESGNKTDDRDGSFIVTIGRLPLFAGACALLPVLAAVAWAAPAPEPSQYAQVTVQQSLIVKMPKRAAQQKPIRWKTKRGPKCVQMNAIAGAAVVADDAIDLVLRGGQRMRAQFSSRCPALDYYSGFYVLPTDDGRICADRDVIRTRAGGQCEIERFRKLVLDD